MPADPAVAKSLFLELVAIDDPAARAARLHERCAGDPELLARVNALLAANDRAVSGGETAPFTPESPESTAAGAPHFADKEMQVGAVLAGKYKLMERIGEGGMGEVWVADQLEPIRRRVALKVIKPGMDSRSVLARFEAERQALALMDHPHIAKVLDAGTMSDGRPYFVMELVKGTPITAFCDARKLTPRERLELFVPVCQAIQHAHTKGIIHRDIKPNNVLVELHDDKPVPKVIDFGVAKAIGQQLTEKTIYTGLGALVGTPTYMAPEQASFNAVDVDTRADVYALGVLLYELLAGSPPFEPERLKRAALDEVLRLVREEEPPRPSARLSTSEARATIAAVRQSDPQQLSKLMRGELDWIVMKALEKERSRRYETAAGLAKDVQRYLADEPVEACPPSVGYRLRKAYRRNQGAISTAFLVVCGLLGAATYAGYEANRANHNSRLAIRAAITADSAREEAVRERDEKKAALADRESALAGRESALRQAQGLSLTLRSELVRAQNPGLALTLAVEGARRNPGLTANNTLLAALDVGHEQRTLLGHQGAVQACAFSPDGLRVVTGGSDLTARVWDATTGRELLTLRPHDRPVVSVAYSPDGQRILTVSAARLESRGTEGGRIEPVTARLWEAATGRLVAAWEEPAGEPERQRFRLTTHAVSFSPDGRRVVTTFAVFPDGAPQVRDTATGQRVFTLDGHKEPVTHVAYSPDGKHIATASTDKTAVLWNPETGKPVHTVRHPAGIGHVCFSPDGKRLLTVGSGIVLSRYPTPEGDRIGGHGEQREDTAGRIWDVETGKESAALKWPDGGRTMCYAGAFSPDGKRVVTTGEHYRDQFGPHGFPWIWDAATGKPLVPEIGRDTERAITDFALFSPDNGGRWLLSFTDRTAYLRDATTGKTRAAYRGHEDTIHAAAFSPDGKRVVTAGADGTARIWTADLGPDAAARLGAWAGSQSGLLSPDGRALLELPSGRLWDLAAGREVAALAVPKGEVWRAAFAADGSKLLTVSGDHKVRLWDARSGAALVVLEGHAAQVVSAEFDPAGARIATASRDGSARVWDALTGREKARFQQTERTKTGGTINNIEQFVGTVEFSPDGRQVLGAPAASATWIAGVWDAESGAEVRVLRFGGNWTGNNRSARFLPDGRILTVQPSGVWNPDSDRVAVPLRHPEFTPDTLCPSPDGRFVAGAYAYSRRVALFDARTGKVIHTLTGHTAGVTSLAFSRDGKFLASGSQDGTARVWDATTGEERITAPHSGASAVAFTPDGRHLLTTGRGTRRWPLDPLSEAEARRPRDLTAAERARYGLEQEKTGASPFVLREEREKKD